MEPLDIDTPHGLARVHVRPVDAPRGGLVLGHGAGGGVGAADLVAAGGAAVEAGVSVALVEQPYRLAGRRAPAPAHQLDATWIAVVQALRADALGELPLIVGGRSMGARVACRTAADCGAIAVLCLAFPLRPPRGGRGAPAPDRLPELDAVTVPTLIVQGERDPFGIPPAAASRDVVVVPGDHSLRRSAAAVAGAVGPWLSAQLRAAEHRV